MKSMTRNSLILGLGLVLGVMLAVGQGVLAERENSRHSAQSIPLEDIRSLSEVFGKIKQNYVEDVKDKELLENAIRGLLSGLDPHSAYLDKKAFTDLREGTSGEFGGLGIVVGMEDGFVKVISPIDDTPAFHAGIKAGDLIIRLNEKPVKGMTLNDAVNIMRGKPGTEITLVIIRDDSNNPLTFTIKRDIIKVKSVKSRLLEKDYGYVRVSTFQSRTANHLKEAIDSLNKNNDGNLKGLVLDLRNNPGGVLNAAADVSDLFLNDGLIVYTKGRVQNSYFEFKAKSGDLLNGAPIVVLINGGSASASEIVAGALQDQKRAVIMGDKSFGKGSVQTIQELRNGGAVKFTTARYFTPSGRSIQADGIEPDILLDHYKLSASEDNGIKRIKEADLTGHISNPDEKPDQQESDNKNDSTPAKTSAPKDYPVNEALNLLKGLSIYSKARE